MLVLPFLLLLLLFVFFVFFVFLVPFPVRATVAAVPVAMPVAVTASLPPRGVIFILAVAFVATARGVFRPAAHTVWRGSLLVGGGMEHEEPEGRDATRA